VWNEPLHAREAEFDLEADRLFQEDSMKGMVAICGAGTYGLITEEEPKEITYPDGNKAVVYVGIHLTDKKEPVGSPWCSRNPKVVGNLQLILDNWAYVSDPKD
jgi:hypothetical protein